MSVFTLSFSTDNAAFGDDPHTEVARILREVAEKVERGDEQGIIRDVNGNRVGDFSCEVAS